jgi:CRISPR-associated protein Csd2
MSKPITNRYDFCLAFDVQDGNPNGDPDAGNLPRVDAETGMGLVTDVCLKRKVRNFVQLSKGSAAGYGIFVQEKAILNQKIAAAYSDLKIDLAKEPTDSKDGKRRSKGGEAQGSEIDKGRIQMCKTFYDIRTFGAVLSTGANAGQVRGPIQITFARSVAPVIALEHSITRMAVTKEEDAEKERTMGRKFTIPYGLYVAHGFVSAHLASQTGFNEDDLTLFWEALLNMFEHDRSAARGLMATRGLYVWKHSSPLGNAPAHELFERIKIERASGSTGPARSFTDFKIDIDTSKLQQGVELMRLRG